MFPIFINNNESGSDFARKIIQDIERASEIAEYSKWDEYYKVPEYVWDFIEKVQQLCGSRYDIKPKTTTRSVVALKNNEIYNIITYEIIEFYPDRSIELFMECLNRNEEILND